MSENPLVSIIVRTKDRPKLLKRALQSISAQTYRPIEVVLVNDGGCDLDVEEIKTILGDVSLNYINLEKNMGRAHAGNTGIGKAKGKYVGFLDDDDEFYPEHVLTLVAFLEQSDYKVAYTGVEMVSQDFDPKERKLTEINKTVFSKDFSYADLLVANYIPFNSIMFDNKTLKDSSGLDETLELYEDWDLLIRIAQKKPFYHIRKNTARYNQWSREQQINRRDAEYSRETHLSIINKHVGEIKPEYILDLYIENAKRESAIAERNGCIARLDVVIRDKDAAIADKDVHIYNLETLIKDKDACIIELDSINKDKDAAIAEKQGLIARTNDLLAGKDVHIRDLENTISMIEGTLGWRMLNKVREIREHLMPHGTARRKLYNLAVKPMRKSTGRQGNNEDPYQLWISKNEPDLNALNTQKKLSKEFNLRPKISIVTPVYNPSAQALIEMIESVISQTYDNWELCLADASSEPYVRKIIKRYKHKFNHKVIVRFLDENKGIGGNSNEALSLATGDFVVLLDHDDVLSSFALYYVVEAINCCPDADFLYSDEDKISEDGKIRSSPHFKPDWSPDTLRSYNYVAHLSIFRKELLTRIRGFRCDFEGSQDYDLILRASEQAKKIIHIPRILYHWRISKKSTAGDERAKPYAYESAKKAVLEHLHRIGLHGQVDDGLFLSSYKVVYRHEKNAKVSIIIPNRDHAATLKKCISSIMGKTLHENYEIIIVENNSAEKATFDYYEELSSIGNIRVVKWEKPFNFSAINNFGAKFADGEILLFLNNDVKVINGDWMDRLLDHVVRKEVGAVGAKLYYPDNTIQHAGVIVGLGGVAGHSHKHFSRDSCGYFGRLHVVQNLSAVTGACLMVRKAVFEEVGGFEEGYPIAFNDVDLCLKIRDRGYLIVWTPYAELYHSESKTRGYEDTQAKQERFGREIRLFKQKWEHFLERGDPYYNCNLTLLREDFSLNSK